MSDHTRTLTAAGLFSLCLMAMTLLPGGSASAQTAAADGSDAAGGAEGGGLQEVVVTARRRVENLQDVPIAVTAVSANTLEQRNVTNLQDLNSFVPNFKISADRATNATINVYIRGVGQSDPLWGFEPGVGVYLDDVYLARPQSALLDVYDVDRIEVLRGPQGTLYGKNTIAGAIKYVSRDIVGPATATATVIAGNYGELDEKVSFSAPIVDQHVYFGAAAANFKRDGFGQVSLVLKRGAEVEVGRGIILIEADGLAQGGDGPVQLALVLQGDAEMGVGRGEAGLEGNGLAAGGDGLVQPALLVEGAAEVGVGHGKVRLKDNGLAEGGDGTG